MLHNTGFDQSLHCLLRQKHSLGSFIIELQNYIVSNELAESTVKKGLTHVFIVSYMIWDILSIFCIVYEKNQQSQEFFNQSCKLFQMTGPE